MTRMSRETEWIELNVHCHRCTQRAVLLSDDGDESNAVWIPRSQVRGEVKVDEVTTIEIADWIAEREGLV